jgi:hypothetical protein
MYNKNNQTHIVWVQLQCIKKLLQIISSHLHAIIYNTNKTYIW